ncbi:MAG: DUF86 domain-containing protein [Deltaproteobacteria bacterium]|nr:DUF86 domain-containing protein [Deltaproteobacteria bacterium]MBW2017903.1 DUF86 domain-containing protein [Deltaproteobacteria bacterium]
MTPASIRKAVVAERIAWIRAMLEGIGALPLESLEEFVADKRNPAAAESYVRRALEALLDLGRHILAKGFGVAVTEYKDIGLQLSNHRIITTEQGRQFRRLAGYRNRLVHFYHEINHRELYEICTTHVHDIETLLNHLLTWIHSHPEKTDATL